MLHSLVDSAETFFRKKTSSLFADLRKSITFATAKQNNDCCGNSSVGRAQPCQGWGREFESRFPLYSNNAQVAEW